ncbi:hypothetical protein F5884DRAFT_849078 [Xylogone sp. PMI_703]|nr:hypothetical protein F5884DRAFT_849078 [Xylogone sp. PMI_703]
MTTTMTTAAATPIKMEVEGKVEVRKRSACPLCFKTFFRKSHMLRHAQQHTDNRPFRCQFCSKTFKRSDVLRDHFQRCDRRGNSAIPAQEERGRKRHACDRCARSKVRCDLETPCKRCRDVGRICVKSRVRGSPSSTDSNPSDITNSDRSSISFLLNYSNESEFFHRFPESKTRDSSPVRDLLPFMEDPTLANDSYVPMLSDPVITGAGYDYVDNFFAPYTGDTFLNDLEFGIFNPSSNWHSPSLELDDPILYGVPNAAPSYWEVLDCKAAEIRGGLLREAERFLLAGNCDASTLSAIDLITGERIDSYVRRYFKHWHKHGPFLHEKSFDACQVALPLLLAVFSIGGMYSKKDAEVEQLKSLLDLIEYHLYTNLIPDDFKIPSQQNDTVTVGEDFYDALLQHDVEVMQGAYLMIVIQVWTGNTMARKRARHQNFSRVVAMARDLRMTVVHHEPDFMIVDQPSFQRWVRRESLLRTMNIMMMLDNAFVIFNNMPNRIEWAEIDLQFPCESVYFEISDYDELLRLQLFPQTKPRVREAFQQLFLMPESGKNSASSSTNGNGNGQQGVGSGSLAKGSLNSLDMQILVHFLYTHVWRSTFQNPVLCTCPALLAPALLKPLNIAIQNWKLYWDDLKSTLPSLEWNKLGFERSAESYWNLTRAVFCAFEKGMGVVANGGVVGANGGAPVADGAAGPTTTGMVGNGFLPIEGDCELGTHLKKLLFGSS